MRLSEEQRRWRDGEGGPALQWAMEFNRALGEFFDAAEMVPVASAHFAPDTRLAGAAGRELLVRLVGEGARARVPATLDPCSVDFGRAAEMIAERGLAEDFVAADRETQALCRQTGFLPTYTCINYQTVSPPAFGSHLAWGDTGTAAAANGIFGARTNFEGGPSALASALLGATPAYGMHLAERRAANLVVRLDCEPAEIADWGAVAAWSGRIATGYDTVPVFHGDFAPPGFNMLKHLAVALASHGGHAMFHVVGATPEAPTLEAACHGRVPDETHVMTRRDLEEVYKAHGLPDRAVDLVVFAAPQLSIEEVGAIAAGLGVRRVHAATKLIISADPQVKAQADLAGLTDRLSGLGAEISTGTCFYPEAPLMREATGWRNVVTNSAKLVNTLASAGYAAALRRFDTCLEAAVEGRLAP